MVWTRSVPFKTAKKFVARKDLLRDEQPSGAQSTCVWPPYAGAGKARLRRASNVLLAATSPDSEALKAAGSHQLPTGTIAAGETESDRPSDLVHAEDAPTAAISLASY